MSDVIYDKPSTSIDPFKRIDKESIHDRNDLVVQQFLEKQANRKKGIRDEADILLDAGLFDIPEKGCAEKPIITFNGEANET